MLAVVGLPVLRLIRTKIANFDLQERTEELGEPGSVLEIQPEDVLGEGWLEKETTKPLTKKEENKLKEQASKKQKQQELKKKQDLTQHDHTNVRMVHNEVDAESSKIIHFNKMDNKKEDDDSGSIRLVDIFNDDEDFVEREYYYEYDDDDDEDEFNKNKELIKKNNKQLSVINYDQSEDYDYSEDDYDLVDSEDYYYEGEDYFYEDDDSYEDDSSDVDYDYDSDTGSYYDSDEYYESDDESIQEAEYTSRDNRFISEQRMSYPSTRDQSRRGKEKEEEVVIEMGMKVKEVKEKAMEKVMEEVVEKVKVKEVKEKVKEKAMEKEVKEKEVKAKVVQTESVLKLLPFAPS
eukprot:CAMPEP_0114334518 /NCGR_PEP_ID=MMETSP0101-20121206/4431_1 /TAXON_ID=38822 ORGANISM="Pteridomonas danica, Strain PT" /NCGR_SAMPLE_ID=MMETSP0101 /ASSEMBLY_ACC=CAM_ASM_000211 /LENGTH=347 /DNA_ID=CAMNT_0001465809 /DNA_START=559 /DNA_END=1603 /DNA_ORIENTATION=-